MAHRPRQLVVHTGGIGDLLLAGPALEQLAAEGRLEIAGYKERAGLLVHAGIAERAHDMDTIAFDSLFSSPKPALLAFLEPFHRVVVWMRDDGAIGAALRAAGIADIRVFPGLPPGVWARHASDYYTECLGFGTAPALNLKVRPATAPLDVVMHPGSGGRRKNWPMRHFTALAARLREAGRVITWCRGPAEEGVALPADDTALDQLELVDLASALAAANLYIGNDSGITHLAAAVGCPTVAVFGPTDPGVWAPRGDHVLVAQGDPWPDVAEVFAAAQRGWGGSRAEG